MSFRRGSVRGVGPLRQQIGSRFRPRLPCKGLSRIGAEIGAADLGATAATAAIAAHGLDSTSSRPVGGGAVLTVVVVAAGAILALSGEFAALTDATHVRRVDRRRRPRERDLALLAHR